MKVEGARLLNLSYRGLIPGPAESLSNFTCRIDLVEEPPENPPIPEEDWNAARQITKKLFGFSPDWILAYYSNQGLRFWEGAAVWIGKFPIVQLRLAFKKGAFLKIYKREEILAHEAVHAVRMQFFEPRFEEVLAYQTSKVAWRRFLGPLFRTPLETLLFLCVMLISMFSTLFVSPLFLYAPLCVLTALLTRLAATQWTFARALKKGGERIQNPKEALSLLFHLTDKEISLLSWGKEGQFKAYQEKQTSLRWRLIHLKFSFF